MSGTDVRAAGSEIVLYASEAVTVRGNWAAASSSGAAAGRSMTSSDLGWSSTNAPLASPANYFEMTFDAPAGTPYRIWARLRATNNSKWNDAVWMQFSDALVNGSAAYRIGTTSGLMVNLERCSGCGTAGWGWHNTAYWLSQATAVTFSSTGTHTIRVQTREDGVEIDQIVLSPVTYYSNSPGSITNDTTILSKPDATSPTSPTMSTTPYSGTAVALPGTVYAKNFDNGGQNISYYDATSGNTGGGYRAGDVDLEASADGGHNIGWTAAGEWLKYTVNVGASGNYVVRARVSSPYSNSQVNVAFDKSGISQTLTVPNSGGWQAWRTVEFNAYLSSGQQVLTLKFPTGGFNIHRVEVAAATSSSTSPPAQTPYSGTAIALPGTVPAANFDNGGQGVAYHDTTSGNSGSTFRSTDVDIQSASIGGYNVGWTTAGEWLKYSVNVSAAGTYDVSLRVAAPSGNTVQVTVGSVTGSFSVPNTGGWQNWTNVTVPMSLSAGAQVMTVKFATGGVNLHSVSVAKQASTPPPSSGGSGGSFRMLTWNIHHGTRKDGVYDLAGQVKFIVAQNPHVVVLQEVQTWSENQPSKLKTLLEQQTGVSWTLVWAPVTSAAGTEGNVVLSRLPVASSATFQMHASSDWTKIGPNRSVAKATVTVGGVPVHVFSTHLDYANTSYRTSHLLDMMEWTAQFGAKRIVGGDFNSWWGEYWITTMMSEYYDTWQEVTGSNQNGYTLNNAVRFDYLFYSKQGSDKVRPTKVYVPVTSLSDHNPVVADYSVVP